MASGYDAICMIGMNPAVRPIFRSLGYELQVDTPRWCGVLDLDAAEALFSALGIAQAPAQWLRDAQDPITCAFPVAIKVASPDIAHKSDAGGVELNVPDAVAAAAAAARVLNPPVGYPNPCVLMEPCAARIAGKDNSPAASMSG